MADHTGDTKAYYHYNRSWYRMHNHRLGFEDEVMFGFYAPGGGTSGELAMRWTLLGNSPTPQLQCYDDAWHALAQFPDLIRALGEVDNQSITPAQFCEILDRCGFQDWTQTERPKGEG